MKKTVGLLLVFFDFVCYPKLSFCDVSARPIAIAPTGCSRSTTACVVVALHHPYLEPVYSLKFLTASTLHSLLLPLHGSVNFLRGCQGVWVIITRFTRSDQVYCFTFLSGTSGILSSFCLKRPTRLVIFSNSSVSNTLRPAWWSSNCASASLTNFSRWDLRFWWLEITSSR